MALKRVLKCSEEWRTQGNRRFPRGRVCVWLVLECEAPDGGHHCEQRMIQLARDGTFTAPTRVRCSECTPPKVKRG